MNKKQILVIAVGVIGIVLIVIFTPHYKITWLNAHDYIITEQSSSLYKQSKGLVKYRWDKIAPPCGLIVLTCGIFVFILREKNG